MDKWVSVEKDLLIEREVDVLMLCETKLMNEEKVPSMDGYCSVSSNRQGSSGRKSNGGVAILYSYKGTRSMLTRRSAETTT